MELVEAGYKMTEVGMIPSDWDMKSFGEIFQFLTTSSFSRAEMKPSGDISCVHYGDIHTKFDFRLNVKNSDLPSVCHGQGKKYPYVRDGDIIMADASEDYEGIGKSIEVINVDRKVISGLHTFLLRDSKNYFANGFRAYIHCIPIVFNQFQKYATGLKVYGVSKYNLKKISIPFPPTLIEQKAIASALSNMDDLISNLDKLIQKKKAIKQGAMQELLTGKTRVAGFENDAGFKMTVMGLIPNDWRVKQLQQCLLESPKYGIGAAAVKFNLNLPTYLRITDIDSEGNLIRSDLKSVDNTDAMKYLLGEGDIALARTGASVGKSYMHVSGNGELVYAGFLIKIKTDPNILQSEYLNAYLKTSNYWHWVTAMSMRSGQPGINSKEYSMLKLPLPPNLTEQKAIATVLSDMDSEIKELKTKQDKYKEIKQGMMQELLTGKIRLIKCIK